MCFQKSWCLLFVFKTSSKNQFYQSTALLQWFFLQEWRSSTDNFLNETTKKKFDRQFWDWAAVSQARSAGVYPPVSQCWVLGYDTVPDTTSSNGFYPDCNPSINNYIFGKIRKKFTFLAKNKSGPKSDIYEIRIYIRITVYTNVANEFVELT